MPTAAPTLDHAAIRPLTCPRIAVGNGSLGRLPMVMPYCQISCHPLEQHENVHTFRVRLLPMSRKNHKKTTKSSLEALFRVKRQRPVFISCYICLLSKCCNSFQITSTRVNHLSSKKASSLFRVFNITSEHLSCNSFTPCDSLLINQALVVVPS